MTQSARPFSYGPGAPAADPSDKPVNADTSADPVQALRVAEAPAGTGPDDEPEAGPDDELEAGPDNEPEAEGSAEPEAEDATAEADAEATPGSEASDVDGKPGESGEPRQSGESEESAALTRRGQTTIATSVVEKVATIAARKVAGVYDLGTGAAALIGAEASADRGLAVRMKGQAATIAITVVVAYGNPVYDVANRLREEVADAVESMLGVDVVSVDIVVEDVHIAER